MTNQQVKNLRLLICAITGCAEVIRVMLKVQGAEFDKNIFFGQLPKFEHCGLTLYQINVVRRHLARKLGRWRNNIKDSGKEGYLKTLPTDLMPFEKTLSRNKGSFLVDNKIHVFLGCFGLGLLMFSCEDFKNGPIIPGKRA
uniref:GST N-terminal domain-containing protein n=1 Tax=Salmo trutta TaxID=8032 RepID=A0A673ZWK6_SALTR